MEFNFFFNLPPGAGGPSGNAAMFGRMSSWPRKNNFFYFKDIVKQHIHLKHVSAGIRSTNSTYDLYQILINVFVIYVSNY